MTHPRQRFGGRSVRYRHYLSELARKPQAVRQVAPELVAELGEPYGQLWALLLETHSELDAARTLARVLGAVCEQGEEAVQVALTKALTTQRVDLLALTPASLARPEHNAVPSSLAGYEVPAGRAADYDHLLLAAAGA